MSTQKWVKFYEFFAQSGSGSITLQEFSRMASVLIEAGKVDTGTRLATMYKGIWDRCLEAVGRPTNLQSMEKDDFVKGFSIVITSDWYTTTAFPTIVNEYIQLMDKDGDGRINIDEWRKYYRFRGIDSEDFVQNTFKKMDTNGDGFITHEEFANAMKAYVDDPESDFSFLYAREYAQTN